MESTRRGRANGFATAAACVLLFASAGCSARRPPAAAGPTYGVYAATFRGSDSREVRFRAWVFARPPGRLHVEILGPAGGARVVVDGGNGVLAVTLTSAGESYVGRADAAGVAAALGLRASLDELVAAFVAGEASAGSDFRFRRDPAHGAGLPLRFEADSAGSVLTLELRVERRLSVPPESLGSGKPPAGTTLRTLQDLRGAPWEPRTDLGGAAGP